MNEQTGNKVMVVSPFANQQTEVARRDGNAIADSASAREMSEVQGMILLAKKFPRDEKVAMDKILNACCRETLAECSTYQYARGGTDVTGPSIRLAEAIAQNWGNLQFGVRELEQRRGESTVEAFAWDVETNTRQSKVFQVSHLRATKHGTKLLTDPRDIYEMVANQGARRVRACILGLIPGDIVDAAVKQCETTLNAKAEITPERIAGMLAKFAEYKVTKEQIEARIQRRLESMAPAQLLSLVKIYNSIKDGMSQAADWFEAEEKAVDDTAKPEQEGATAAKGAVGKIGAKLNAAGQKKPSPAPAVAPAPATEAPAAEPPAADPTEPPVGGEEELPFT